MNMLKRTLALMLVLCMMFTAVPFNAFATESTDAPSIPTEAPVDAPEVPADPEKDSEEEVVEDPVDDAPDAETPDNGIATASLDDGIMTAAITMGTKPADGTVTGEPFPTSVSTNHRIPGLVNHNGTLIAVADARWNKEYDGGSSDIVVSRSTDGNTWNYTFAGYLGDYENVHNKAASTMMDPLVISDGTTLYLFYDLFPAGLSLGGGDNTTYKFEEMGGTDTGFNSNGNLLLSKTYLGQDGSYYLDGGKIYAADGTEQTGYTVDGWFNVYKNGAYQSNLFFSADSDFYAYPTSYIAMQTSTDGAKWTDPQFVNVKPSGELWSVLGPGSGIVTSDGKLAFTIYSSSNCISLVYGTPGNWNTLTTNAATNESSIVELPDGTIRAFVKRTGNNTIAYVDFVKDGDGYAVKGLTDTYINNYSSCMVSSLLYSKTYEGKPVVLVCCPSVHNAANATWGGRFNGKIYAFSLGENNAMTLIGSHQINNSFFAYSDMAELANGTIGLLYEDSCISYAAGNYYGGKSHITYTNVNLETALGITFDAAAQEEDAPLTDESGVEVTLTDVDTTGWELTVTPDQSVAALGDAAYVAYDITISTGNGNYEDPAEVTLPLGALAGKTNVYPFVVETDGTVRKITPFTVDETTITFTAPHFSVMGVAEESYTKTETVTLLVGDDPVTLTDETGNYEASYTGAGLDENVAKVAVKGTTVEGKTVITPVTTLTSNDQFYIQVREGVYLDANASETTDLSKAALWYPYVVYPGYCTIRCVGTNYYLNDNYGYGYPTVSQITKYLKFSDGKLIDYYYNTLMGTPVKVEATAPVDATDITITPVGKGQTSVVVGNTKYEITVDIAKVNLHTYVGMSKATPVTGTVTEADIAAFNAANGSKVTVAMADGQLTFTGVAAGTVTATLGGTEYTITISDGVTAGDVPGFNNIVGEDAYSDDNSNATYRSDYDMAGKKVTKLTISENASFNLNVDIADAESVTWEIADTSIATVNENGVVTGVKAGTTTLTATVIKDGKVESVSIPVVVKPSLVAAGQTPIDILYYIDKIDNTTPYYTLYLSSYSTSESVPGHTMEEVIEDEVIFLQRPDKTALAWIWTASPDEDHALVYMASSGTVSQYYPLKDTTGALGESDADSTTTDNQGLYYKNSISYKNVVNVGTDAKASWQNDLNALLNESIDSQYLCDGACSNTRWDHDGVPKIVTAMTFVSDPMPKISKSVDGVLPTSRMRADYRTYTPGMLASVDELVYFKIDVTVDRPSTWRPQLDANGVALRDENDNFVPVTDADGNPYGAVTYSNAKISDTILDGAYIYTEADDRADGTYDGEITAGNRHNEVTITDQLNAAWKDGEESRTITYYLVYRIQTEDIPKFEIDNVANLNLNYQSYFSEGLSARAADAMASIAVVGHAMDNVVIDFGQTITYTGLTDLHLKGVYTDGNAKFEAKYGTVTVTKTPHISEGSEYDYTVTYTPTAILQEPDAVRLYGTGDGGTEKVINGFLVYPATTIYYEEGFMLNDASTMTAGNPQKATGQQEFELLGKSHYNRDGKLDYRTSDQKHAYGYDPLYATEGYDYGDSYIGSKVPTGTDYGVGEATTFTFTGTGFDLYANCTNATGTVSVQVKNADGKVVKFYAVNTKTGFSALAGQTQDNEEYHLPIVSEQGLYHGTYTVTITKIMQNGSVELDGVRIFNTVKDSTVFGIDLEDNPEFYQLRNYVQKAVGTKSKDYAEKMPEQVYGEISADTEAPIEAVILDNNTNAYTGETNAQTLLDKGPKNELFLYKNQTLTFKVTTNREMQIGLKAPVQAAEGETPTSYTLTCTDETGKSVNKSGTLNTSVDMFYPIGNPIGTKQEYTISITNTGSNILSVTDLKICDDPSFAFAPLTVDDIAAAMGVAEEPEVPETPVEPEVPETSEPEVEETTKPTEPEVEETTKPSKPGKPSKPEKPGKPENTKPTEPQKPGKPGNNGNQKPGKEEKTYTLKITFVNLFGKKVGTATITTTSGVVSVYEIVGKAPARYNAIWFIPVTLNAHGTNQIVVPVI